MLSTFITHLSSLNIISIILCADCPSTPPCTASVVKVQNYAGNCLNLVTASASLLASLQNGTCIEPLPPWELLAWYSANTSDSSGRKLKAITPPENNNDAEDHSTLAFSTASTAVASSGLVERTARRRLLATVYVKTIPYTTQSSSTSTTISSFPSTSLNSAALTV